MSEFTVPRINLNRVKQKQKTAAELQALDQFIATFSVNILRYMKEKAAVAATVAKVTDIVNNTVDAMNQVCVTEADHEVVDEVKFNTKLAIEELTVNAYEGDDEAFRALFRNCVENLVGIVDAWKQGSDNQERQDIYVKVYKLLDRRVKILTKGEKSFFEIFANEFEPAVNGMQPPFDIWRKINLCAMTGTWKILTMQAIKDLTELAFADQCKKHKLSGVLKDGKPEFEFRKQLGE